jgi:hypothetical protein
MNKFKEIEPAADLDMVRKIINTVCYSYWGEFKFVKASDKSGSSYDVCIPTLWYFEELEFLED